MVDIFILKIPLLYSGLWRLPFTNYNIWSCPRCIESRVIYNSCTKLQFRTLILCAGIEHQIMLFDLINQAIRKVGIKLNKWCGGWSGCSDFRGKLTEEALKIFLLFSFVILQCTCLLWMYLKWKRKCLIIFGCVIFWVKFYILLLLGFGLILAQKWNVLSCDNMTM